LLKKIPDRKVVDQGELKVLERCYSLLSDGKLLQLFIKEANELEYVQGFQLSTLKPLVICINVSDEYIGKFESKEFSGIREFCEEHSFEYLFLPGSTEEELADLDETEAKEYLEAVGIKAPGIKKLIEKSFNALNLITFYTAGETEAHAWILTQGSSVLDAAGKIHTDMQKGFIKAEVIHYGDFLKCKTVAEVRKEGHFKLVGREYIVQDGDYIVIRFN
ncbi:MAG TPA: redox-regulated ATPase YchF, partial [Firmicutes bacterium]|nr:redox-regulated ATPase YchF [Bacillota bacterium]